MVFFCHGLLAAQGQVPCKLRVRILPEGYRRMGRGACNALIRMTDHRSKPGKEKGEDMEKWNRMGQWIRSPGVAMVSYVTRESERLKTVVGKRDANTSCEEVVNDGRRILSKCINWREPNKQFAYGICIP